jgi:carboxyl-terminal processing protease
MDPADPEPVWGRPADPPPSPLQPVVSPDPAAAGAAKVSPAVVPVEPSTQTRASVGRPSRAVFGAALGLVVVLAGGALFFSGYTLGQRQALQPGTPAGDEAAFQPFWDAYRAVVDRYAGGPIDREALIGGAIRGMVGALDDPYSAYLTPADYKNALEDLSGQFEGIGAQIGTRDRAGTPTDCATLGPDCRLGIIAPLDGSPAQASGLRAGDMILAVDGTSLDGLTVSGARDRIRGQKGTSVVLTIVRAGGAPFDVSVVRDVIVSREVTSRDLADGQIGYIKLSGFSDGGANDLVAALREDLDAGRTRIILDLRGNPGGFIDAARKVTSQFVKDGPILWQEDSKGNQTPTPALDDGIATDPSVKLAVLIDRGSASASEIVAGALQDLHRAILVGERSYGKGTVQQWTDLGQNGGGLKLTIAKWLTPEKRWIHGVGVVPDVVVTVPDESPPGSDPALDRAIDVLEPSAGSVVVPADRAA